MKQGLDINTIPVDAYRETFRTCPGCKYDFLARRYGAENLETRPIAEKIALYRILPKKMRRKDILLGVFSNFEHTHGTEIQCIE